MKRIQLIIAFLLVVYEVLQSQTIIKPNYGLKSHETLEITRIELDPNSTVIHLIVENRIEGGSFCADKNLFIIYPDGTKSKMIQSAGIPNCPSAYKFKMTGEKLAFTLVFPPLKPGTEWIDLVEECSENCFSFYGVTLDDILNNRLNKAFAMVESGRKEDAIKEFTGLLSETDIKNPGIDGILYSTIIRLFKDTGNIPAAAEWYSKMKNSGVPRIQLYIKNLNSQGIIY